MAYLHHFMRNEHLLGNLADLESCLAARGVNALYLKGPWLAFAAYPDRGTRPVGDIDLCIQGGDYTRTIEALEQLGYKPADDIPGRADRALSAAHFRGQLRFAAPRRRPVELHHRLVNVGPPAKEEVWVWESARGIDIDSVHLRVPGPEAMLLHLLLHANQHGFAVLRLLHDIRWALEASCRDIDWSLLDSRVRSLRCRVSAYHALALARDLAGANIPEDLLDSWRAWLPRRALFSWTWHLPAARRLEVAKRRMELESPLFYILEVGSVWEKLCFLAGIVREAGGPAGFFATARRILGGTRRG